jgi:NAD-dependent deacetylase
MEPSEQLLELIESSTHVTALTGAGISTESGIPDYRTPGKGLWNKVDMSVVSLAGFIEDPSRYYTYSLDLYEIRSKAEPNPAHYMLAKLEKIGKLKGIVTQNVDGLHTKAGSINVHELHGSLRQVVCMDCSSLSDMESAMSRVIKGENPPRCEDCGGVLKPNAVFFGEALPRIPWEESVELVKKSDLLLAIGSSLQVSPANVLPDFALKNGVKIVIMNQMPTPYDTDAQIVIRDKIGEFSKKFINFL